VGVVLAAGRSERLERLTRGGSRALLRLDNK
jgi:choline kinase